MPMSWGSTPPPSVLLPGILDRHDTYPDQDLARNRFAVELRRQELPLREGLKCILRSSVKGANGPQGLQLPILVNNASHKHRPRIRGNFSFASRRRHFLYRNG